MAQVIDTHVFFRSPQRAPGSPVASPGNGGGEEHGQ